MNEPKQPAEPGTDHGVSPAQESGGDPGAAGEHEPKGRPTSDRAKTETAAKP